MRYGADCRRIVDVTRFPPSADPVRPVSRANLEWPIDVGSFNGFDVDSVHLILGHLQIALERRNPLSYSGWEMLKSWINMRSLSKIIATLAMILQGSQRRQHI